MSVNQYNCTCRLTADPETRYTPNSDAVVNMRVAVNSGYKDKTGEWQEEVCFLTVTVYGKQAERCRDYRKGDALAISGKLQEQRWEDKKTGTKRSRLVVAAANVERIDARRAPQDRDSAPPPPAEPRQGPKGLEQAAKSTDGVDDIPF